MDDLRKVVGQRLKERRLKKGFKSQKAFAEALGTDQSTVGRWEAGLFLPATSYLEKIYSLLGTDQLDLFGISTEEARPETPTQAAMAQVIAEQQKEIDELRAQLDSLKAHIGSVPIDILAALSTTSSGRLLAVRAALGLPQVTESKHGKTSAK